MSSDHKELINDLHSWDHCYLDHPVSSLGAARQRWIKVANKAANVIEQQAETIDRLEATQYKCICAPDENGMTIHNSWCPSRVIPEQAAEIERLRLELISWKDNCAKLDGSYEDK